MDISLPLGLRERHATITLQHTMQIRTAALAQEISVVSRRTDAHGAGCASKRVAEAVRQTLELVGAELDLIAQHNVVCGF